MDPFGSAFDVQIPSASRQCFQFGARRIDNQTAPEPEDMTSLVASEMNKLSFKEREVVYEDLHAVSKPEEESSVNIDDAIRQLRKDISSIRLKPAYNKALFLNREYVDSRDFLLMFLRFSKFNTKEAAQKLIDHFKYKLALFGPDLLAKDIMYEDLDQDTKDALSSGAIQILPQRDIAGRAIIFFSFDKLNYRTSDSQCRVIWYLMMCNLSDPETQMKGIVMISYNLKYSSNDLHLDMLMKSGLVAKGMPQKIMGIHFCYNSEMLHPLSSTLQLIIGTPARLRYRSHYGSHLEVAYSIVNFGIPKDALPIDQNGNVTTDKMRDFIEHRVRADEKCKQDIAGKIMHPLCVDVVLGRGWHQQEHPGNLHLARIVDDHREVYKSTRKLHKINLNWRIVELIKESGGRFLERSQIPGEGWIEASDESARDKVSKCFRTQTRRSSMLQKKEESKFEGKHPNVAPDTLPHEYLSSSNHNNDQSKKARVAL